MLFSGLMAIVSQLYLPELLKMSGLEIKDPPQPSLFGLFADYFGDSIIYLLIIILIGMNTFSGEVEVNKQVYFLLSRPISRTNYYFIRTFILLLGINLVFITASMLIYGYALLFFDPLPLTNVIGSMIIISLQFTSLFAIIIFLSTKFSASTTAALGFLFLICELLISLIPALKYFSIIALGNEWINIILGTVPIQEFIYLLIAFSLWISIPIILGFKIYLTRDL